MSLVIKVCESDLNFSLCGGAIGKNGIKICVKLRNKYTIGLHSKKVLFILSIVSFSGTYMIVWLTQSVTFEKVEAW